MFQCDESKGEWRCRCKPERDFDKSVNPSFVAFCSACGMSRPGPGERPHARGLTVIDFVPGGVGGR